MARSHRCRCVADADADAGTCGDGSRIGHVQVAAGPAVPRSGSPSRQGADVRCRSPAPTRAPRTACRSWFRLRPGPFDLGRVVARSPLHLDRVTAQLSTGIDVSRVYDRDGASTQTLQGAMPTIVEGIPLRVRDLRVIVDRKDFTVNPTSCAEKSIDATLKSTAGQTAAVSSRFQVGDCPALGLHAAAGDAADRQGPDQDGDPSGPDRRRCVRPRVRRTSPRPA